jgi:hypothetical protein
MSEFRVEKERTAATLTLSDGTSVCGSFFLAGSSASHNGRERVKDLLDAEPGFFPFEVNEGGRVETRLYNRDHVVFVRLENRDEPRRDPGYALALERSIAVRLAGGERLAGSVRVYCPQGRDRLSDYARAAEPFRYLETPDATLIVNARYVVELSETTS